MVVKWNLVIAEVRYGNPLMNKVPCYSWSQLIIFQGTKTKKYKKLGPAKSPCYKRVIVHGHKDLFITRFHCNTLLTGLYFDGGISLYYVSERSQV